MIGKKQIAKRKAEAEADRQVATNFRAEAEREQFWKDLITYEPRCSHCQKELTTRRNESVLVIDRLSCVGCFDAVRVAALPDNPRGMEAWHLTKWKPV